MNYAKIIVKNNYEQRGDLVLRSYIRALKKIGSIGNLFLNDDGALIYGVVDSQGRFHELFTNNVVDYNNHFKITSNEYNDLYSIFVDLTDEEVEMLKAIMGNVLFEEDKDLGFEVSTIEELAYDRAIEFDAYNNYLSCINPYHRLSENDSIHSHDDYNSFLRKIEKIKRMKKNNYIAEYDEYEVLENPKRYIKKYK